MRYFIPNIRIFIRYLEEYRAEFVITSTLEHFAILSFPFLNYLTHSGLGQNRKSAIGFGRLRDLCESNTPGSRSKEARRIRSGIRVPGELRRLATSSRLRSKLSRFLVVGIIPFARHFREKATAPLRHSAASFPFVPPSFSWCSPTMEHTDGIQHGRYVARVAENVSKHFHLCYSALLSFASVRLFSGRQFENPSPFNGIKGTRGIVSSAWKIYVGKKKRGI